VSPSGAPVLCFINPGSGSAGDARSVIEKDSRFRLIECDPDGIDVRVRDEVRHGTQRIAVCGGDGTVASVATAVAGADCELAILPGGTLNHFARSLGIPGKMEDALQVAAGPGVRQVDVGYVNDRLFLNTSSLGLYVTFVHARDEIASGLGYHLSSLAAAFRILRRYRSYSVHVSAPVGDQKYRTPILFVGVGERELQFPSFGRRAEDGRSGLHVIAVRGQRRVQLFRMAFAAAIRGTRLALDSPDLESFMVDSCRVSLRRSHTYVALDGETVRMSLPLEYRLERGALRVVVPTGSASPAERMAG
jgi:diacylglycerol kinase family enzyme